MKKFSWLIPVLLILISTVISIQQYLHTNRINHEDDEIPGNPGYYAQLFEMKKNEYGVIDWDLYNQVRDEVADLRMIRAGGLFSNVAERGPNNVGGRTRALLVDYADSSHIFAGGVGGGLWVSTNRGTSWAPVNDDQANLSISSITQSPFDHNIFYFSGGESAGNSDGIPGNGIYKSVDGGVTFNLLPASGSSFNYTWNIAHSLTDTNEVFIGTPSFGLWQTQNAGVSFRNVLPGKNINDLEVFPDGSVIIAAHHDGLYYSPSGDSATFTEIGAGLPTTGFNRVQIAYCKTNPNYVYAMYAVDTDDAIHSFWQSTDQGVTWTERTNPSLDGINMPYPWYCMMMFVDDNLPQQVIIGGVDIGITFDGGGAWIQGWDSHADYHIGLQDPMNPDYYYVGNDGGVHRYDVNYFGSTSYELNNGYNVTQFYAGHFFPDSIRFWGGTQDNGTQSGKQSSLSHNHIFGGDGAFCAINQQADYEGYVSWQNGHIQKTLNAHSPYPDFIAVMNEMDADQNGDIDDATWFINPFDINELEGQQLYFPTRNRVWRSITGSDSWEHMTGPLSNIYAVGISNEIDPIVYCGGTTKLYRVPSGIYSAPGDEVQLSFSIPFVVNTSFMSCISVSPRDHGTLFISFSTISNVPKIYKVTNANTASPVWTSIQGDLPAGLGVNWVDVSPYYDNYIVLATDFGVFTTSNGGVNWILETDIPNVHVDQVRIRSTDCKVFVYTHGRGVWTADIPLTGMSLEDQVNNETMVYPTISLGDINIKTLLDDYDVEIYNLSGQKILNAKNKNLVSLGGHPAGMYLVSIYNGNKRVFTQKVFLTK